jgi:hypothetical protein
MVRVDHLLAKEGGAVGANRLRRRKWLESRCLEGAHRSRGISLDVGDRFWGHFDDVKAKVEYTALVSVEIDLETGDVLGWHPPDARRGRDAV